MVICWLAKYKFLLSWICINWNWNCSEPTLLKWFSVFHTWFVFTSIVQSACILHYAETGGLVCVIFSLLNHEEIWWTKECISAEIKPNIQNVKKKNWNTIKSFFKNSSQVFKVDKRNLWICADFMHLFSKLSSTVCISRAGWWISEVCADRVRLKH